MTPRGVSLLRSILREHRIRLPPDLRKMGDAYVKEEFRLHKMAKMSHLQHFYIEWESYLKQMQASDKTIGKDLDPKTISQLSPEQRAKLSEMKTKSAEF